MASVVKIGFLRVTSTLSDGRMKILTGSAHLEAWEPSMPLSLTLDLLIAFSNGRFTWSDFRTPPTLTLIDRFLLSDSIISKFSSTTTKRLERITSNHFPISLTLGKQNWGPLPFKFENMWLQHSNFLNFVEDWWKSDPMRGWPEHGFIQKLKGLKGVIKSWNVETFGCIH